MLKRLFLIAGFLFIFLCPCAWSVDPAEWKTKYGENLEDVPLIVRQQFQLATGQVWFKVTVQERLDYLNTVEAQKLQAAQEKERALRIAEQEKQQEDQRIEAAKQAAQDAIALQQAKKEQKAAESARKKEKLKQIAEARRQRMQAARERSKASRSNN